MTKAHQYQSESGEDETRRHASKQASSRGRVSQSFYFHANRLSFWQSNASILEDKQNVRLRLKRADQTDEYTSMIRLPNNNSLTMQVKSAEEIPSMIRPERSIRQEYSQGISVHVLGTDNSKSQIKASNGGEAQTTMHDEQGLHPYFSNPNQIRSMKSLSS